MRDLSAKTNPYTAFMADIYIYISIDSMLTTPCTSRTTGRFVFFFSACSDYHGQLRSRSDGRIFRNMAFLLLKFFVDNFVDFVLRLFDFILWRGRLKKSEGWTAPESRGSSLAVGTYIQRGSAPSPPGLLHQSVVPGSSS